MVPRGGQGTQLCLNGAVHLGPEGGLGFVMGFFCFCCGFVLVLELLFFWFWFLFLFWTAIQILCSIALVNGGTGYGLFCVPSCLCYQSMLGGCLHPLVCAGSPLVHGVWAIFIVYQVACVTRVWWVDNWLPPVLHRYPVRKQTWLVPLHENKCNKGGQFTCITRCVEIEQRSLMQSVKSSVKSMSKA